jgi:hypothetical protein
MGAKARARAKARAKAKAGESEPAIRLHEQSTAIMLHEQSTFEGTSDYIRVCQKMVSSALVCPLQIKREPPKG